MQENNYAFTYTYYRQMDENSRLLNKVYFSPHQLTYSSLQRCNKIGCLTVVYDASVVGLIQIPKIDKRNDYALWLKIFKIIKIGYLLPEVLSYYRHHSDSLSRKQAKLKLLKYHYQVHREIQGYQPLKAAFYTIVNAVCSVIRKF